MSLDQDRPGFGGHLKKCAIMRLEVSYDDPGFAPIRARQEARQVRERNRFLAIVCTDNPYEAVWQPAERACERFVEVGGS